MFNDNESDGILVTENQDTRSLAFASLMYARWSLSPFASLTYIATYTLLFSKFTLHKVAQFTCSEARWKLVTIQAIFARNRFSPGVPSLFLEDGSMWFTLYFSPPIRVYRESCLAHSSFRDSAKTEIRVTEFQLKHECRKKVRARLGLLRIW